MVISNLRLDIFKSVRSRIDSESAAEEDFLELVDLLDRFIFELLFFFLKFWNGLWNGFVLF